MGKGIRTYKKSLEERLAACEYHARLLLRALHGMKSDPMDYKQVAGQCRVLVADHKPKNRLLLRVIEETGVAVELPPGPPLYEWTVMEKGAVERWKRPIPLDTFCERGLAFVYRGRKYSVADFIKLVSQQEGTSHEAPDSTEPVAAARSWTLGDLPGHAMAIERIGKSVCIGAQNFFQTLIRDYGYEARYEWFPTGPDS